jgi:hypothetical protein
MKKPNLKTLIEPSKEFEEFYLVSNGIKIVPEFYNGTQEKILQRDSGTFAKWIHKNHTEINIDYDPNVKKISLHNNEYWLPLVYLASDISVQIYLGLVINFLYDKLKGSLKGEKSKVNFSFEFKEGESYKKFNYSGDVEGLEKFTKINLNKLLNSKNV